MSKEIKIKYGSNELSFRASYIEVVFILFLPGKV